MAPDGGAIVCGNSLGGCVALLLAERSDLDLAGIVPVAPAGLDMARWFAVIERDPLLRTLLAAPVPMPRAALQRVVGEVYKRLAFHRPGDVDPRVAATFAVPLRRPRHHRPAAWPPAGGCSRELRDPSGSSASTARCCWSGAART